MDLDALRKRLGRAANRAKVVQIRSAQVQSCLVDAQSGAEERYDARMSESGRVVAFPDTNIFLHFRPIAELDWKSMAPAEAVLIEVCPTVTRELEKHKVLHPIKRIRERAASALKMLYRFLEDGLPSKLSDGVELNLLANDPSSEFAAAKHLNFQLADDLIIATLLEYQESHPDAKVLLVSADLTFIVKARHYQINTVKPPEHLRLPDDPTPEEQEIKALEGELRLYKNRVPDLVLVFDDGKDHKTFQIHSPNASDESEIHAAMNAIREKYPLTKPEPPPPTTGDELTARLTDHMGQVFKDITATMQGLQGDRDLRLKRWYGTYEQYLREVAEFEARQLRTIQIDLMLMNMGTCPAEDVDINLHFPDGFIMYNEDEQPERPDEPSAPSLTAFDPGLAFIRPLMPELMAPELPNPHIPKIRKTNSYDVTIRCGGLKHEYVYNCNPLYLAFDSFGGASSFSFKYNVHAANAPLSQRGELHVILDKV